MSMPAETKRSPGVRAVNRRRRIDDALDELYDAPLREFVARRKAIAARLRERGRTDDAKAIAAVGKPKMTVWAINRVARTAPKLVARVVTTFDQLRAAQLKRPEQMTEATRSFREAVEAVVHRAIGALTDAGLSTTLDTHRRMANTLRGAATNARGALVGGALTGEVAPAGFELFAGTTPRGRRLRAVAAKKTAAASSPRESKELAAPDLASRRAAQLEAEAGSKQWDAQQAAAAVFKARQHLRALEETARTATRTASKTRRLAERARARARKSSG
jgi:hypothetical protein